MSALRSVARTILPASIRRPLRRMMKRQKGGPPPALPVSYAPEILQGKVDADDFHGWHEPSVAEWQNLAYRELIEQMYAGNVRQDMQIAADAIRETGIDNPTILEVGCGSGYYGEILAHLLGRELRYTGLDYSQAMITLATEQYSGRYPEYRFVVGDATAMEFADGEFEIVINGAALMHIPGYEQAIAESRRVASRYCIFHTVPMLRKRETTTLKKKAYGDSVVEITFNQKEFENILDRNGLALLKVYESISHDYLSGVMGEPVNAYTYLCEVR